MNLQTVTEPIPLIGTIIFGILDRGSNLIQIRPITTCPLDCIFCSTNAGNKEMHKNHFIVELNHLLNWAKKVAKFKGNKNLEMDINAIGESASYPQLIELTKGLKKISGVDIIDIQTDAITLTKDKIKELEKAGMTRINFSLNAIEPNLAKEISGTDFYDVEKIKEIIRFTAEETKIKPLIAPVWVPGINDKEMPKIIKFVKSLNYDSPFPKIGIQKYEIYKYGKKIKGVKEMRYYHFYKQLDKWEKEFNIKLKLRKEDFGIHKLKKYPLTMMKGDKVETKIVLDGWNKNQMIGVANNRTITVLNTNAKIGDKIKARILNHSNNIYIAKQI